MKAFEKDRAGKYKVKSLERALDILDSFNFQNREMSFSELVKKTGLNKTTAKRLISNLADRGYLQQEPSTRRYQPGLRLFELGGIVFSSFSLRRSASTPMTWIQKETGATVLLGIMMDEQLVYVDKREGRGMIRISSDIGWRRPLNYGMLGMVLMAYLEPRDAKRILAKEPLRPYTPFSITDENAFGMRLEQVRKDGYVVEREEAVEGVMGIAAPIRDYSRHVIAALGIALPLSRRNVEKGVENFVSLLKEACKEISTNLGYLKI